MKITTTIFLNETEIREIIKTHLINEGYEPTEELEIIVRSKKDIPEGATAGDVVGINATVKKN